MSMIHDLRLAARASAASLALAALLGSAHAQQSRTYTLDADFDEGVLVNVNHSVPDQLQLDLATSGARINFAAVAASGRGTIIRFDTDSGAIYGEYRTGPEGLGRNPSRTSIDSQGNVWVGNRDKLGGGMGSVCRIGLIMGGTRVDANGTPNPSGQYLAPPFDYNTCFDRDGDGLIRTSRGLGDVLGWPNVTDGVGGPDGLVQDALDECIQIFQRVNGPAVRHVSVDANDDVWVGGYPDFPEAFDKLSGVDGAILTSLPPFLCGGHGGIVDGNGVLWSTSLFEDAVLRYDPASGSNICIPVFTPHGIERDSQGNIWIAQFLLNAVTKIAPDGTVFPGFPRRSGGATFDTSVAVTFADDNVWVANSNGSDVSRLDNNGNIRKVLDLAPTGSSPRGVAVDAAGKVWVTNFSTDNAMRIDPNAGTDGLGAVDLTVPLGPNAAPDDYGDFTGQVFADGVQPNGSWTVVYDSGAAGTEFGRIGWNASIPAGTGLGVSYRAANLVSQLDSLPFVPAVNGQPFSGVFGRFVQIRVEFTRATPTTTASPVLFDLTIESLGPPPPPDCEPGHRFPSSLLVFPEYDNRAAAMTVLTVTNTDETHGDVEVEFVYIARRDGQGNVLDCIETNRTHRLTPLDTLTVVASAHDPNPRQGYVYAFAKHRTTHQPFVHDALIGNALVIDGAQALDYSFNAFGFLGVGAPGDATDRDGDGLRDLNDREYQCSSGETLVPRFLGQSRAVESELVLINLTGGARFEAVLDFLIYNDNEEAFSAQHAFTCWEKARLRDVSNVFTQQFLLNTSNDAGESAGGTETGWFRIDGNVANSSATSLPDPAFLALLIERIGPMGVSDLPFETGAQANGDLVPRGVLGDVTP